MAKNDSLAVYKARGSAGPITYANWKGIGYFKQKAFIVANPKTDGQLNARARLRTMVTLFQLLGTAVNAGFREMAVKMSAYNAFVKENINSALTYIAVGDYVVDESLLKLSKGTLGNTPLLSQSASAATNNLTVTYDSAVVAYNQSAGDLVQIAYDNVTSGVTGWNLTGGATRADGTATIAIEGGVTLADDINVWVWFKSPTGIKVSDSVYVNVIAGA